MPLRLAAGAAAVLLLLPRLCRKRDAVFRSLQLYRTKCSLAHPSFPAWPRTAMQEIPCNRKMCLPPFRSGRKYRAKYKLQNALGSPG